MEDFFTKYLYMVQNVEMSTTNTRHYSSKYELSVEGVGKPAHER